MTNKEVKALNSGDPVVREQKEALIIAFNPLLTGQIQSKYIEYPSDINGRTIIASGGPLTVTESIRMECLQAGIHVGCHRRVFVYSCQIVNKIYVISILQDYCK
jgi:hypothetical protein